MRITLWPTNAQRRKNSSRPSATRVSAAEVFEQRALPSVSALVIGSELDIASDGDDTILVSSVAGNLFVQAGPNGGVIQPVLSIGTVAANSITSIIIQGGDAENLIDVSNVRAVDFTSLTSISVNSGDGADTLTGSPDFADSLSGQDGADVIAGQGGNDTLDGGNGSDTITGGAGNDSIRAGDGMDNVDAGDGNDTLDGGNGSDVLNCGIGDDIAAAANGEDTLNGDAGNDTLNGDGGADTLNGGAGNDAILGGEFADSLQGGDGNDTIDGQAGNDIVNGDAGNDSLLGGIGNDTLNGNDGDDFLNGMGDNDSLLGSVGNDTIYGGAGDDSLIGDDAGTGNDVLRGQAGNDTLIGGGGADNMDGGDDNDVVRSSLAAILINDFTITEPDSGTADVTFTVILTASPSSTVTVNFATADGSATSASDYVAASGTLTFLPGVTSQTLTVQVVGDTVTEQNETFVVNLSNAVNAGIGDPQGLATITDNDAFSSFGTPFVNVAGQGFTNLQPPDTAGDVGPNHYVQVINGAGGARVQIYNKTGTVLSTFDMDTLAPGGPARNGAGDGVVLYDELADRWVFMEFTSPATPGIAIYVSQTPDPTNGQWFPYFFATAQFPDYPKIAVWPDSYVLTTNEGTGPAMYAVDRINMLTGAAARPMQRFTAPRLNGFGFQALTPADMDGVAPPAGNPSYFMRHRDDEAHNPGTNNPTQDFLELWQLQIDFNVPANSSFTQVSSLPIAEFDSDLNGLLSFSAIVQPAPGPRLDPLREVIMHRLQYRNFGAYETLVGSFVTDTNATDHAGVRWFELRRTGGGAWTVFQDGLFNPDNVLNRWMSAIAMDAQGNIAIGYSVTNATTNPGLRYAGRRASDPLNQITTGEFTIIAGLGPHAGNRWGDYAALGVDPADGRGFWFTSEYALANGQWATRVAGFGFPNLGGGGGTGFPTFTDIGDTLTGGIGNDTLIADSGNDTIISGAGNDSILAGAGNDSILGGAGADTINGEDGNDTLNGQGGTDSLDGGAGNDMFVWEGDPSGNDSIADVLGDNTLQVVGTTGTDTFTASVFDSKLRITNVLRAVTVGPTINTVLIDGGLGADTLSVGDLSTLAATVFLSLRGGDGDDTLSAVSVPIGKARLLLSGGEGNDTILGGTGNETLVGGNGNDSLDGGAGLDTLVGDDGNDTLDGGDGNDSLLGGLGDDSLLGNTGNDVASGGDGVDSLDGGAGNDTLSGDAGNDSLLGLSGNDSMLGGVGADTLGGGADNDTLDGGRNDDSLIAGTGNDKIRGDHGNDTIDAGDGDDTVNGGDGNDSITGGIGNDGLNGGNGDDALNGAAGNDTILGGDGRDVLVGGGGNDLVLGEDGDDSVNGQSGTDTVAGNQGVDVILDLPAEINEAFVISTALRSILEAL